MKRTRLLNSELSYEITPNWAYGCQNVILKSGVVF